MMPENYYQLMAQYNQWMNKNLYAVCADIPDTERKKNMGAFFKSIHGTLNHILVGDLNWMARFLGEQSSHRLDEEIYSDFDELHVARGEMDKKILNWAENLDPSWLQSDFEFVSRIDNAKRVTPAWILVTHLFNHQTHHRGQLTTLIKQLGYEPGVTDMPWLPSLQ